MKFKMKSVKNTGNGHWTRKLIKSYESENASHTQGVSCMCNIPYVFKLFIRLEKTTILWPKPQIQRAIRIFIKKQVSVK